MQLGKGLLQAPDGENTSLNKVVTDHIQKQVNVKQRNDKLSMRSETCTVVVLFCTVVVLYYFVMCVCVCVCVVCV